MGYRSRLIIHLDYLKENFQLIQNQCPDKKIIFMVKSNAYGHGAVPIVRYSVEELGIKEFGVATLAEALELRDELHELEFELYVFSDIQMSRSGNNEVYLNRGILPVLSSLEDLNFILGRNEFSHFPLCLKFNSGMNRLGLELDDIEEIISKLKSKGRHEIHHLMTHFACASQSLKNLKRNHYQDNQFQMIKSAFKSAGIQVKFSSRANSGMIEQLEGSHGETHIRPGLAMYGPTALIPSMRDKFPWKGKVISQLETYILKSSIVKKGTPVGYGASALPRDGHLVILALGYGDGFHCHYQGAHVYCNEFLGQVVGRVNMDMIQVLLDSETVDKLEVGQSIRLWNEECQSFMQLCDELKTIPYEVLCSLTPRVPRVYLR